MLEYLNIEVKVKGKSEKIHSRLSGLSRWSLVTGHCRLSENVIAKG